jgi:hypothetical protein
MRARTRLYLAAGVALVLALAALSVMLDAGRRVRTVFA